MGHRFYIWLTLVLLFLFYWSSRDRFMILFCKPCKPFLLAPSSRLCFICIHLNNNHHEESTTRSPTSKKKHIVCLQEGRTPQCLEGHQRRSQSAFHNHHCFCRAKTYHQYRILRTAHPLQRLYRG